MHRIVRERLEELLPATLESAELQDAANHLRECEECLRELADMRKCREFVQVLRPPENDVDPRPGFYGRLMDAIAFQRPSPWSIFFDRHFAKRLVYAAMTALVLMGTYLVSNERIEQTIAGASPETIIAIPSSQDSGESPQAADSEQQRSSDRDHILVQLATFSQ